MVADRPCTWIGWAGSADEILPAHRTSELTVSPVPLSSREVDEFYAGYANSGLWPLLHDALRPVAHDIAWARAYRHVNARFARSVARSAAPRARVVVNDYQLMLVPAMLRELRPDLNIAYFLHTPFPHRDTFAAFPDADSLLRGLLGADVVGVQTVRDSRHLRDALAAFLSARIERDRVRHRGHVSTVRSIPVGVDTRRISQLAASQRTLARAVEIRHRVGRPDRLLLGVDRLDYTKGIEARLLAYHMLLRRGAVDPATTTLVQVAVPSRQMLPAYEATHRAVVARVEAINAEFGSAGAPAVHLRLAGLDEHELVACYRAADVMVVTPMRDGMNLVAKEYVAARVDLTGGLVLSTGAGAAEELFDAHLVDPDDPVDIARGVVAALGEHDRGRSRMRGLRAAVLRHDVHHWGDRLLDALG
jgi:trehalose 6-phosphate synthase